MTTMLIDKQKRKITRTRTPITTKRPTTTTASAIFNPLCSLIGSIYSISYCVHLFLDDTCQTKDDGGGNSQTMEDNNNDNKNRSD